MLSKSRVKYIQSLNHKKFRDNEAVFIAEGPKIIAEFLATEPNEILSLYAVDSWIQNHQKLLQVLPPSVICSIEEADLQKISSLKTPNQVLAVVKKKPQRAELPSGMFLILDGIQDPGNFGTIIRTADWFGIPAVMCSMECADLYNPKVVQSTMGSILRVEVGYVNLHTWCEENDHIAVYAATLHGKSLYQFPPITEGALLIGNESKGIQPDLLRFCSEQITIPRVGMAESLNAAVATGILLSHLTQF